MRVLISGASGFIGTALSARLRSGGHDVVPLQRSAATGARTWSVDAGHIDAHALEGIDAIVHLAGESIGGRWTESKKRAIRDSRVDGTSLLASAVADAKPTVFISGSAIGFYGSRDDEVLDETAAKGKGFLSDVVEAWEAAARPAVDAGVRTVLGRTALVVDPDGGSLPRMLLPFRAGLGGRIGPGDQWWAWITLGDHVRAIEHLLTADVEGPVNLTSPQPVPNRDFVDALGNALGRPTRIPVPAFALRLGLGREFADEVLLASQRVVPRVLESSGFGFDRPTVTEAMNDLVG